MVQKQHQYLKCISWKACGNQYLRSSGDAVGLLPQRTSSVRPRISTYSARLVCRVFGLFV